MNFFTRLIVRKSIPNWKRTQLQSVRSQYGILEGWTSIIINSFLFILKGLLGLLTGSVSLIGDAFHTLSDISTSIVIMVSFRVAKKPSDATHPFGHGRMEAIATVIVAVLLVVVGLEILKGALDRLFNPEDFKASWWVIGLILFTIIIKEWLARFSRDLGRAIQSNTIEADFWHHRTDAISSLLVIVAFIGQRFGLSTIDGIAGILVAGLIVYTGWEIARKGIDDLLGKPPSNRLVQRVKQAVRAFPEVIDVHDLVIHQYGQCMVLSCHIEVSDQLSLKYAHDLAERVETRINKKFHTHTTVHLDPMNVEDNELKEVRLFLKEYLKKWKSAWISYHALKVETTDSRKTIFLDLVADPNLKDQEVESMKKEMQQNILEAFPAVKKVVIDVEPRYAF
jgi:cation diffusion facilitator family transporter